MTEQELDQIRQRWQLNAAQFARILCVHTNKMSEYLAGVSRIPCAMAMHIEALELLPETTRATLFTQRLQRKPHSSR